MIVYPSVIYNPAIFHKRWAFNLYTRYPPHVPDDCRTWGFAFGDARKRTENKNILKHEKSSCIFAFYMIYYIGT